MKIDQKFHHFEKWEDFKGGLFNSSCDFYDEKLNFSIELLSDQERFLEIGIDMCVNWAYAAEQNLTDTSMNRRAWLGQATCCFHHEAPDYVTKDAWWKLSEETRKLANATADKILADWQSKYIMKGSLWQN